MSCQGNSSLQIYNLCYIYLTFSKICVKAVSGDDDLPKRDDIGERRKKHELQVLARAGIVPDDEADGDADMGEDSGSEDEFYKQSKQQKAAKIAAKAEVYTRFVSAAALYIVNPSCPGS